jgi:hypothetical protein
VDRRRIELQIDAVLVPFRIERVRRDRSTMDDFRARARDILDGLDAEARQYPDLEVRLNDARRELHLK